MKLCFLTGINGVDVRGQKSTFHNVFLQEKERSKRRSKNFYAYNFHAIPIILPSIERRTDSFGPREGRERADKSINREVAR